MLKESYLIDLDLILLKEKMFRFDIVEGENV